MVLKDFSSHNSTLKLYRYINSNVKLLIDYIQGVQKKTSFSGKTAITTFKLIENAKVGGVLENSGYLLHHGHSRFAKLKKK